jgi:dTDP-4-amino-4,6-dideoxygalactose transaminase
MSNLIHIDLVPNFEDDDYEIIKKLDADLRAPYQSQARYGVKTYIDLEKEIEESKNEVLEILKFYFPQGEIFFFNSARGALSFLLTQTYANKIYPNDNRINYPNEKPNSIYPNINRIDYPNNNRIFGKNSGNKFGHNSGKVFGQDSGNLSLRESIPEIITQAFSCLVVPNAIKFAGYKPIYVDIDETYNLDIEDLKRKINERTKAIIVQNTFGIPAKIDEILEIAHQNNILVIENLTHSLGAKYEGKYLGNFGDFALLSFNRNKVISSIIGGALVVNNKNFLEKIKNSYESLPELSPKEIQKIIFTGKVLYEAKKNYNFLTKIYLKFLRKSGKILEMISSIEKQGKKPENYLFKFPEILFPLLLNQLKKLEKLNEKRKEIANIYLEKFPFNFEGEPIFLRFPILIENRDFVLEKFKKENIYLGDWYRCVLDPCSDLKFFDYKIGSCPKAEVITKKIINLPTLIDKKEAEYIIKNF